jgi:hypothetical protein
VRKHLGEAAVFESEVSLGYPDFDVYVIGCLSHAAWEALEYNQDLSECIRSWRLLWELDHTVQIPYDMLSNYIGACIAAAESEQDRPELPDWLKPTEKGRWQPENLIQPNVRIHQEFAPTVFNMPPIINDMLNRNGRMYQLQASFRDPMLELLGRTMPAPVPVTMSVRDRGDVPRH